MFFSADVDDETDDGFESRPSSVAKQSSVCTIQWSIRLSAQFYFKICIILTDYHNGELEKT